MTDLNLMQRVKKIFPNASITEAKGKIKVHQVEFEDESLSKLYTLKENKDIVGSSTIRRSGNGVTLTIKNNLI